MKTCALCLLLCLAAAPAAAQTAAQPPFRVDVEGVEIDVRVIDRDGHPVPGLTASDFEIHEDGVRQEIRAFMPVRVPVVARASSRVESDVQSNRQAADGRVYAFVLDDLHTHPLRSNRVKSVVRQFLDRHFGANDMAAIVTTSGREDAVQQLTGNRAALMAAVDAFHGSKLRSSSLERVGEYYRLQQRGEVERGDRDVRVNDPFEPERAHMARRTMTAVRNVARWLDTIPARRKTLIFVSEGIDYDLQNFADFRFSSGVLADVREAIAAAARSSTAIYTVDPRGLGGIEDETIEVAGLPDDATNVGTPMFQAVLRTSQDSLRMVAEQTGGFAILNTNDLHGRFAQLVREGSEYYLLGYQSTNPRRDGRFRRVEVRVSRPDVRVVARQGYFAREVEAPPDRRPLQAALESPVPLTGLPVAASAAVFKGTHDRASVVVTAAIGPGLALEEHEGTARGRVTLAVFAVDMDGKVAASDTRTLALGLRSSTREVVDREGLRAVTRLELKPGKYQLRVAARDDRAERIGTVLQDVIVPDFAEGAIAMAQLVLGGQANPGVAAVFDSAVRDALGVPPTTARQFEPEDNLVAMTELYDNRRVNTAPVQVVTSLVDAHGRAAYRIEETVEGFAFDPSRRAYRHRVSIPLRDVAAGDYVLRVEARPRDGDARPMVREVPISVRPGGRAHTL